MIPEADIVLERRAAEKVLELIDVTAADDATVISAVARRAWTRLSRFTCRGKEDVGVAATG